MRYAKIRSQDISNGPGIRVSIFVQGCSRHCKNCFNPETWDFNGGHIFGKQVKAKFLSLAKDKEVVGFSILGGEPLQQGDDMLDLVKSIKEMYPKKTIWMWTGYKFEDLTPFQKEILKYVDTLVDGEYIEEQKSPGKRYKGSYNQRILDVQQSLAIGKPVVDTTFSL